jgi:hypothetical protein
MRTSIYEQWTVSKLANTIPGSGKALHDHDIDITNKLNFANSAAVVSASTDQVLAIMEHRLRSTASRLHRTTAEPQTEHVLAEEGVGELVA